MYNRFNVTADNAYGASWQPIDDVVDWAPSSAKSWIDVAGCATSVWGVDSNNDCYYREDVDTPTFWVDQNGKTIRAGFGRIVGQSEMVRFDDPGGPDVHYVAVQTVGGEGRWTLSLPGVVPLGAQVVNQTASRGLRITAVSPVGSLNGKLTVTKESTTLADAGSFHYLNHFKVVVAKYDRTTKVTSIVLNTTYDTRDATKRAEMANVLRNFKETANECYCVTVASSGTIGMSPDLVDALRYCGASSWVRSIPELNSSIAYALVGIPGRGENTGLEAMAAIPLLNIPGATIEAQFVDGALDVWSNAPYQASPPMRGSWEAADIVISGVPKGYTLTNGRKTSTAADGTSLWVADKSTGSELHLESHGSVEVGSTSTSVHMNLAAGASAHLKMGPVDIDASVQATNESKAGLFTDGHNAWVGYENHNEIEARAAISAGRTTMVVTASAESRVGSNAGGGFGSNTIFNCPDCDGTGLDDGPGGTRVKCERCDGTGEIKSAGVRGHFFAGGYVEASVSVQYESEVMGLGVTQSGEMSASYKAGAYAEGEGDFYWGDGRYGSEGEFDTYVGESVETAAGGSLAYHGNSVTGAGAVSVGPQAGIGGGYKATYDDEKVTMGLDGLEFRALVGVSISFEVTIDTGPLQQAALTAYDDYGKQGFTVLNNWTRGSLQWMKGAGGYVTSGSSDLINWGASAGAAMGDFMENKVGGAFMSTSLRVGDFFADDLGAGWAESMNEMNKLGNALITGSKEVFRVVTGGKCFITTAVVTARGEADDGLTLSTLRRFRDEVMLATSKGRADVAWYEANAPIIVAAIDAHPDRQSIYDTLDALWIQPAVQAVQAGQHDEAYRLYRAMVVAAGRHLPNG